MRGSAHVTYAAGKIQRSTIHAVTLGAVIALWNDVLLSEGRSPLGFINPFLYSVHERFPEAFRDITTGHNVCLY